MGRKRIFISAVLVLCLLLLPAPASATNQTTTIRQLINYYRCYQEDAWTDIDRLLSRMEDQDEDQAALWRSVMENWSWVNTELEITPNVLPDNLPEDESLCIVVMGYKLNYSGTMAGELVRRLEVALASAQKYPNAKILVTGGTSAIGNKRISEATRMADWLISNGIPESRIIKENIAYSTETNAVYVLRKLKAEYPDVKYITLITSDYHMHRVWLFFSTVQLFSQDDKIDIMGNAAYVTGARRESFTDQANGMAELAGVSIKHMSWPSLAKVTDLSVLGNTVYSAGDSLDVSVTAYYNNGFSRDVTAEAEFSGFDPFTPGLQTLNVRYEENGHTASTAIHLMIEAPETTAPAIESTAAPETVPECLPSEPNIPEAPETESPSFSWLMIPLLLALFFSVLLYQQIQKKKRRKRRRKKMYLE